MYLFGNSGNLLISINYFSLKIGPQSNKNWIPMSQHNCQEEENQSKKHVLSFVINIHRYLIEVDCSLGQFKSAKLKDKEHTVNAPFFHSIAKKV